MLYSIHGTLLNTSHIRIYLLLQESKEINIISILIKLAQRVKLFAQGQTASKFKVIIL